MSKHNEMPTSTSQINYKSNTTTCMDSFTTGESYIGFNQNRGGYNSVNSHDNLYSHQGRMADVNSSMQVQQSTDSCYCPGQSSLSKQSFGLEGANAAKSRFGGGGGGGAGGTYSNILMNPSSIRTKASTMNGIAASSCKALLGSEWAACPDYDRVTKNYQKNENHNHNSCEDCYCCQQNDQFRRKNPSYIPKNKNVANGNPLKMDLFFCSKYSSSRTVHEPLWMESCGKILRFFAYYQEPIPESALENYRIHQCDIHYFVEDGSFEVYEKKTFDPGFTQGRLIRRHKIPLPEPCQNDFFTIDHIEVGCEITFYGKTFYICGCDEFTRQYVNRILCKPLLHNQEVPVDPYTTFRHDQASSLFPRPARIQPCGKLEQFLNHYQKVLRFWAYWDDRCNEGFLRKFIIHYFLEDDTVEIKEVVAPNSGLDASPTFFQRGKLLKNFKDAIVPPDRKIEAMMILNLTAGNVDVMRPTYLHDRLCPETEDKNFYTDRDFAIGAVVNVYERAFTVTDCDEFTKNYYRQKYGLEDFTPLVLDESKKPWPRMQTPPHIGFGDEEDTRANWDRIQIAPPKHSDLKKMIQDKDVLVFGARFYKPQRNVNRDRRFLIRFYMADGTIQIYEKYHPNTGCKQGTFLTRTRVLKSGSWNDPNNPTEYFCPCDFFVGNILTINSYNFQLMDACEPTLKYMETHYQIFPHSDLCKILNKTRECVGPIQAIDLLAMFTPRDSCLQGVQSYDDFKAVIKEISKCSLSEHEIITLGRSFKVTAPDPGVDWSTLQCVIQTELRRHNFDKQRLQKIEYILRHHDPCRLGVVDRPHLSSAVKGLRIPVSKLIIDLLIAKFPAADNCDRVNYCEFMKFLNFIDNPAPAASPSSLACIMKFLEPKAPLKIFCVNYRAFLESICPNFKCAIPQLLCPQQDERGTDGEECVGENLNANTCQNDSYKDNTNYSQVCQNGTGDYCTENDRSEMDRQRFCLNADDHRQEDFNTFCMPPSQSECCPWFATN